MAHLGGDKLGLEHVEVMNVRSFLQLPLSKDKKDPIHVDTKEPHWVVLYYLVDSDGDTIIYNTDNTTVMERVTPKQGRVVIFDGKYYHTAEQPKDNVRCIINFNVR